MSNRRVVVTGLGAITPVGNNVKETWESLKSGKNGRAPITLFDTEKYKAKLGAEVKNFDPKDNMEVNDTLRTDRYAQFAVAAAQQAVEESEIQGNVVPERKAICSGKNLQGETPRYVMLYDLEDLKGEAKKGNTPVINIRTFGYFDVIIGDKPIAFRSQKSEDLFALLVDRRSGYVSSEEAIGFLWEDETYMII